MTGQEPGRPSSDLTSIIRRRRMTRRFDGGPDLEDLLVLLETALRAPTAGFSQGVHLLVLAGEDLAVFWNRSGAGRWFSSRSPGVLNATQVVLVLGDERDYTDRYGSEDKRDLGLGIGENWTVPYWLVDASMVADNVLLLVEERRWGALFFGLYGDQSEYFSDLGIPTSARCVGAVAVGYRSSEDAPSGSPVTRPRRAAQDLLHIGSWS